jgi:hypothetical protein
MFPDHISVPAILVEAGFIAEPGFHVHAIIPRSSTLLALFMLHESKRQVVMIERINGKWTPSTLQTQSEWDPVQARQNTSSSPQPISQLSLSRYAPATHDGSPPESGWITLTGVAALDAEAVIAKTALEVRPAVVTADGTFAMVVRGGWSERPRISVQTVDHDLIEMVYPT